MGSNASPRLAVTLGALLVMVLTAGASSSSAQSSPGIFGVPAQPGALQGRPTVRVDTTEEGATRHVLDDREAEASLLTIKVDEDGRLFWGDDGRPLVVTPSGEFTYLSSATEPGRYVRVRRLNDRFSYVEHVDKGSRSVTYWGELRLILGKSQER